MRKKTIEYEIYKFEELSDESKEVARERWRDGLNEDFNPYDKQITESFQYELEQLGYPEDDVNWSLNNSQGDGVAFYGSIDTDMMNIIVKRFYDENNMSNDEFNLYNKIIENNYSIFGKISRNSYGHHYSHWNTMTFELDSDDIQSIVEELFELEFSEKGKYQDKYDEIVMMLNKLESFISGEIKEVSKKLEKQGYDEIDYQYNEKTVDENLIGNEYEFTKDGKIY